MEDSQKRPTRSIKDAVGDARTNAEIWGNHGERVFVPGIGYMTVGGKPKLKNPVKTSAESQESPDAGQDEERWFY